MRPTLWAILVYATSLWLRIRSIRNWLWVHSLSSFDFYPLRIGIRRMPHRRWSRNRFGWGLPHGNGMTDASEANDVGWVVPVDIIVTNGSCNNFWQIASWASDTNRAFRSLKYLNFTRALGCSVPWCNLSSKSNRFFTDCSQGSTQPKDRLLCTANSDFTYQLRCASVSFSQSAWLK